MSICFGICTYNRKNILMDSARSLNNIDDLDRISIRVYDDASTDYDEAFLHELFPTAVSVVRREQNLKADRNTSLMFEDFLRTGDEWLVIADSDLIYRKDIVGFIERCADRGMRAFSLFNTCSHTVKGRLDDEFVLKRTVGAAGCCFSRDIVQYLTESIENKTSFWDYQFSDLLYKMLHGIPVSEYSYVQHIGIVGQNSSSSLEASYDYGDNFYCDSLLNAEIIEKTFEQFIHGFENIKEIRKYNEEYGFVKWFCYGIRLRVRRKLKKLFGCCFGRPEKSDSADLQK